MPTKIIDGCQYQTVGRNKHIFLLGQGNKHPFKQVTVVLGLMTVVTFLNRKTPLPVDIYQWDVCNLPLKSNSVDVFISDLPFGKKSGSKHENWKLYPKALEEMARVCSAGSGRAVLLTQDKRVMGQVLNRSGQWKKDLTLWINMGGLKAGIYVLARTKQ